MRLPPVLVFASLFSCIACGGTASETPWPHEPEDVNLGPAGEANRDRPDQDARPKRSDGANPAPASSTRVDPVAP